VDEAATLRQRRNATTNPGKREERRGGKTPFFLNWRREKPEKTPTSSEESANESQCAEPLT